MPLPRGEWWATTLKGVWLVVLTGALLWNLPWPESISLMVCELSKPSSQRRQLLITPNAGRHKLGLRSFMESAEESRSDCIVSICWERGRDGGGRGRGEGSEAQQRLLCPPRTAVWRGSVDVESEWEHGGEGMEDLCFSQCTMSTMKEEHGVSRLDSESHGWCMNHSGGDWTFTTSAKGRDYVLIRIGLFVSLWAA